MGKRRKTVEGLLMHTADQKGVIMNEKRTDTHEGFSLTCRVNVLTLITSPNGFVISRSCSSGKLGGKPLI